MKKQTVANLFAGAFFVLLSTAALNNSEIQQNNLIGTWELISYKYTTSDSTHIQN